MNLFIIGPSGCGKSTQAKLIAEKYGLTHFSMGQLLRDEMAEQSVLGLEAKVYVDQGRWVPNPLIYRILTAKLETVNNQNFIIDGFPRHFDQGVMMEQYLTSKQQAIDAIIHLDVTFEEIIKRRTIQAEAGHRFSNVGRTDETPASIAARQKSYEETINPILDYFQSKNKLWRIEGNRPIDPIFADICSLINTKLNLLVEK
ncbi:MAG TPA: nucleoside monophosphate kinase [Candidatus Woesebacteria bacterium]|nr:nucleoside monophosphate kinase [Candidatus Woesebacteria bacterium]HRS22878.1 nucleoside monophosphate kinase [Candidatus Woesebacteria bacterium]HRT39787.1 nucleoside monophosphate kinase [Candidatus Woesebacteria bacterium]